MQRQHKPINPEEEQIVQNIRNFLSSEGETDFDVNAPLAASVARLWASFLDDTWVWGGELNNPSLLPCPLSISPGTAG